MGVSIRAYARRRGVDESTVRKALKTGRIATEPDGTIDPARADAAWKANTSVAKRRNPPSRSPLRRAKERRKAVPKAAVEAARETLQESGQRPAGSGMTFMEARTANEVLKVQTARIKLQRLKGELIDRARAIAHAFRFAREVRDAWLNWPERVGARPGFAHRKRTSSKGKVDRRWTPSAVTSTWSSSFTPSAPPSSPM
ncbi:MAG: elements of external origin [Alphaproteobacteria bacterium]